jgi:hypothetical protein
MLSTDVCGANLNAALEKREFVIEGTIVQPAIPFRRDVAN